MKYRAVERRLPRFLRDYILHFEAVIEASVSSFAAGLAPGARVLDAGAGETRHAKCFARQRYVALDLAVGDSTWDYSGLDALGDLLRLPFADASFDACLNVVTLEHLRDPARAISELARVLRPGGRALIIAPHEWEVHQAPHDFFRFTRHGLEHLLAEAGFGGIEINPVGGYFRLVARRLLNGLQFFPGVWVLPAALFLGPPALLFPAFEFLDRKKNFTLGYVCTATKPS